MIQGTYWNGTGINNASLAVFAVMSRVLFLISNCWIAAPAFAPIKATFSRALKMFPHPHAGLKFFRSNLSIARPELAPIMSLNECWPIEKPNGTPTGTKEVESKLVMPMVPKIRLSKSMGIEKS